MLFKTTDDIRAFCPTFAGSVSWSVISPIVSLAELTYIIPAIGQDEYDDLESKYTANSITGKDAQLLGNVQRALSFFVSYMHMKINSVQHSDAGTFENTPANAQVSRQWKEQGSAEMFINVADESLDRSLAYLESNANDFPIWKASTAYTVSKELFITNATDLTKLGANINNSRSAYMALRPYILIVEESYIIPAISQAMYDKLKQEIIDGNLSGVNTALVAKIRPALAQLTLVEGIPYLNVSLTGTGLKVITTNDAITQKSMAGDKEKTNILSKAFENGNTMLVNLKSFIESATVGTYPEFDASTNKGNNEPRTSVRDNSGKTSFSL